MHLLPNLVRFGQLLRRLGLDVPAGRMVDVTRALEHVALGRRREFYHTLRCLLVHRAQDLAIFDEAFRTFWRRRGGTRTEVDLRALGEERRYGLPEVELPSLGRSTGPDDDRGSPLPETARVELQTYSAREVLREKDFAKLSAAERSEVRRMMAELDWRLGLRRTRRWTAGSGPAIDLRRLLRFRGGQGSEPIDLPRRGRKVRRRPLVLLCDVSGSMERYSRMLLQFVSCLASDLDRVEAFLFATRLTRITPRLRRRKLDDVLETIPRHVPDFSGGTRIGEALRTFNLRWARRMLGHGPVVLLISDGWDRGDPELLAREIARLQRSCHRLVWLNPLLGSAEYEPLTRGMQAALPFVDDFLPVHNLASLESLARHLESLPARRPPRRDTSVPAPGRRASATAGNARAWAPEAPTWS